MKHSGELSHMNERVGPHNTKLIFAFRAWSYKLNFALKRTIMEDIIDSARIHGIPSFTPKMSMTPSHAKLLAERGE